MIKRNKLLTIIVLILLLPVVYSVGSVSTTSINPATASVCGPYANYVTITTSGINNLENDTLQNVVATLNFDASPGLSFITSQSVNLGDLSPYATSGINPSWTLQCNSPVQGIYDAYVVYTTDNSYTASSIDEQKSILTVYETASFTANFSIIQGNQDQEDYPTLSDNTPTIYVQTNRNAICKGTLDVDESYDSMDFIFYGIEKYHNYTFNNPVSQGDHTVFVKCKDDFNNVMPNSLLINFKIDTQSPGITVESPGSKVLGEFTELIISANEDSECRYETKEKDFAHMDEFDIVTGNRYTLQLTELKEETYTYYVQCKDNVGNIAYKTIEFEAIIPPKIEIKFERDPPLTLGTYELRVIPSKELRSVPQLFYTFTDDTDFRRDINLVKDGDIYTGYIIIGEQSGPRSGEFTFKGVDLQGNVGDEITQGAAFLVDTNKPPAPSDIIIKATNYGIELNWYYDGEKPKEYVIYRSTTAGVTYISNYDTVDQEIYLDESVSTNQLYYYRIAAVDIAGNVGVLSKEVSAYAKSGSTTVKNDEVVQNKNPPTEETREWKENTQKEIETLLIDLDWAESNLKEQKAKESAIDELGLLNKIKKSKEDIQKLKTQLTGLDLLKITDPELRDTLSKADAIIAVVKATTPQSLELVKSTDIVQALTDEDIKTAIDELFNYRQSNYSQAELTRYIKVVQKLNDKIKVENNIKTLKVQYLDNEEETSVLIKKTFSYESPTPIENVFVTEIVPKTLAGDISKIDIRTPDYTVINPDPVFNYYFESINFDKRSFTYHVLAQDDSELGKSAKTVVLVEPENVVKSGGSMFTGFSVFAHELSHWIKDVRKNLPQHIQAVLDQREKDFIALVEQAQEYAGRNCEFSNDDYWEFMREHHVSTNGEVEIDIVASLLGFKEGIIAKNEYMMECLGGYKNPETEERQYVTPAVALRQMEFRRDEVIKYG